MKCTTALLLGSVFLAGCFDGRLTLQTVFTSPPLPDTTMVAQLPPIDRRFIGGRKVATVSYICGDYYNPWTDDQTADYLRQTALQHGANLVKVTTFQRRYGRRGGRASMSADFYCVSDARNYIDEEFLEWSAERKLRFGDFKYHGRIHGDTATIRSYARYDFVIVARFHPDLSWIDNSAPDSAVVLLHQQSDFDLCEVYCRQYLAQLREYNWYEPVIKRVYTAWQKKRDLYELETANGRDEARQAEWTARINRALAERKGRDDPDFGIDYAPSSFKVFSIK